MQRHMNHLRTGFAALLLSTTAQLSLHAAPASETPDLALPSTPGFDLTHEAASEALDLRATTYIAVYYSPENGNWGWGRSNDLELAKAIARGYCNSDSCQYIFWTQNACAVLAIGANRGYGWAWDTNRLAAVQNALQNCSNFAASCKVVLNECT